MDVSNSLAGQASAVRPYRNNSSIHPDTEFQCGASAEKAKTYLATDIQRPGEPLCVVKKLSFQSHVDPNSQTSFQSGLAELEYSRELFQREAEALEDLGSHPAIPQLLAYFSQGYEFYLVEEYIPGDTLEQRIHQGKLLSLEEGCIFLEELLTTLDYIHSKGVIHRDIKPSNIICSDLPEGRHYKLIDFGAIKDIYSRYSHNRKFTGFVGTPGYAPPEQFSGQISLSCDIYALGRVAIEALTGFIPQPIAQDLRTQAGQDSLQKAMRTQLVPLDPPLAMILGKMIDPDPSQRYATAAAVIADLAILR